MSEPYNRFSGQSVERLTALTDGLFAVAMTLLVLDLRVPVTEAPDPICRKPDGQEALSLKGGRGSRRQ
jgi:uncharacterized membrane protein